MAHDDHYHVHSDPKLPPVPAIGPALPSNLTVQLPVPLNSTVKGRVMMSFYSLERDLAQLRRDAAAKGILSKNDRAEIGTSNGPDPKTMLSLVIGGHLWPGPEPAPKVLIVGCHHAREWISVEVPYLIAEYLVDRYDPSPGVPPNETAAAGTKAGQAQRIKHLVGNRELWFVPMLNAEGHNHTILQSRTWRPNRSLNPFAAASTIVAPHLGGGSRSITIPRDTTFIGVDINRNYATKNQPWGDETTNKDGGLTTSRDPSDAGSDGSFAGQFFCGKSPESERETAAIAALMRDSDGFAGAISYHNFAEDILAPDAAFNDVFTQEVGNGMSSLMAERGASYPFLPASGQDPVTGDALDFFVDNPRIHRPAFTIELSPPSKLPDPTQKFSGLPETEIRHVFQQNLAAALALINCAGFSATPHAVATTFVLGVPPWVTTVVPNCWDRFQGWDPTL
jgi:hypothetical protein